MLKFLCKRILQALLALFILATLIFFMFRLLPADPTAAMADNMMSAEMLEQVVQRFGLDKPLYVQYFLYLKNIIFHFDFGRSFFYNQPVLDVLGDKILNTLILGITGIVIAYIIGTLLGALMAWYRGSKFEQTALVVSLACKAAPQFWVGMILIMIFSFKLGWLPHAGMREIGYTSTGVLDKFLNLDFLRHLVLPVTVMVLYYLALPMLLMRNAMLDVKYEDFIELAYAKGLPQKRIIFRHAARNALLPVATTFATTIGRAIGGVVLIEYVFSWPGLGNEIVLAATRYDYPLAQASFLLIAALVMVANIMADLLYGYLDPRIVYK